MTTRRMIILLSQGLILAAIGGGLYLISQSKATETPSETKTPSEIAVRYGQISVGTVHRFVTAYGRVIPAPVDASHAAASARITAPRGSLIGDVDCIEGRHVEKGQLLFTVASRFGDGPDNPPAKYPLPFVSPLSGTVVASQIRPGEIPDPTRQWIDIVDFDRLVVDADLPAWEIASVAIDQDARIIPAAQATTTIDLIESPTTLPSPLMGKVALLDAQVDGQTGMGSFDVAIPAKAGLRPGKFVKVKVIVEEHRDVFVVPADSLVAQPDGGFIIYLVYADFAIPTKVSVGIREGDLVEVTAPQLRKDQTVVTTGAYAVVGRSKLRDITDKD